MNFCEIPKIIFPEYEKLKRLKKDKEYIFTLFDLGFNQIYGRFTLYEDFSDLIYFDVIVNGYSNTNQYTTSFKFNKANYKSICHYAQECYNKIFMNLFYSPNETWRWEYYFNDEEVN